MPKAILELEKMPFQFLIGTLQTTSQFVALELSLLVSIPYRYATNTNSEVSI